MIRAYKFLIRPTVGQQSALAEMLRDHCSLYNGALVRHEAPPFPSRGARPLPPACRSRPKKLRAARPRRRAEG
jgi:hypothetical protein